jgi:hypothetical protein
VAGRKSSAAYETIPYSDALRSYFEDHKGVIWSTELAPTSAWRPFIHKKLEQVTNDQRRGKWKMVADGIDDFEARFYLIDCLLSEGIDIRLYWSLDEATRPGA